jgi:hypothetical protein
MRVINDCSLSGEHEDAVDETEQGHDSVGCDLFLVIRLRFEDHLIKDREIINLVEFSLQVSLLKLRLLNQSNNAVECLIPAGLLALVKEVLYPELVTDIRNIVFGHVL